jgi:hypothetical protein
MQDPARQYYKDLLDKTAPNHSVESLVGLESPTMPAVEDEAAAVAKALGIMEQQQRRPKSPGAAPRGMSPGLDKARRSPLVQVTSAGEYFAPEVAISSPNASAKEFPTSGDSSVPKPIEPAKIAVDEVDTKGSLNDAGKAASGEENGANTKEQAGP